MWRGGTRQTSPYSLCAECAASCGLRSSSAAGSGRSAAGSSGSKKEEQGEEKRSHEHGHVDGVKDSLLEPRCVCARRCTDKKKLNSARSRSDNVEVSESGHVVIGVRIVQCHHASMDNCEQVVIGVRVMHCHHAFMANVHFWSQFQLVTCSQFQLVVILYELIVVTFIRIRSPP